MMPLEVFRASADHGKTSVEKRSQKASAPGRVRGRPGRVARSATDAMSGIPEATVERVKAAYRATGGRYSVWDASDKQAMIDALFVVENDFEHRLVAKPPAGRTEVHALNAARLRIEAEIYQESE